MNKKEISKKLNESLQDEHTSRIIFKDDCDKKYTEDELTDIKKLVNNLNSEWLLDWLAYMLDAEYELIAEKLYYDRYEPQCEYSYEQLKDNTLDYEGEYGAPFEVLEGSVQNYDYLIAYDYINNEIVDSYEHTIILYRISAPYEGGSNGMGICGEIPDNVNVNDVTLELFSEYYKEQYMWEQLEKDVLDFSKLDIHTVEIYFEDLKKQIEYRLEIELSEYDLTFEKDNDGTFIIYPKQYSKYEIHELYELCLSLY